MIRNALAALALVSLAACGAAPAMDAPVPLPELDAGAPDAIGTLPVAPEAAPGVDGGTVLQGDGGAPESATPTTTPEAAPPVPEAAPATDDAAPTMPEAGPAPDAGTDAGSKVCTAPTPSCSAANTDDAAIRATFTQPCSNQGAPMCGGLVQDGIPMTYPMLCIDGAWRLGGRQVGTMWVVAYECSRPCANGKTCAP